MRILMLFLFLSVMQPVMALTKCTQNGRVTYKSGVCPPSASSQYLVKDQFIDEGKLQRRKQERISEAEEGFDRLNQPSKPIYDDEENGVVPTEVVESQAVPVEPAKMRMSDESPHFQLKAIQQLESTVVPELDVVSSENVKE